MTESVGDSGGASGRFVLRLRPELHATLRSAAADAGMSLNAYCAYRLALPDGAAAAVPDAADTLRRAADLFGRQLIGLLVFGSWARGESTSASDVDVLIVIDSSIPIRRSLYRRWDAATVTWHSRTADPHFVHLPGPGELISGLWAEAARDGIVLLDRDLSVARHLALVRNHLMSGGLVRRTAHGQGYWIEESVNAES